MARDHTSRGLRDEASVGPDPRRARELKRLSDLKFRVADGEPDIVGWTVFASTGRELGKVRDLLVDVEAREVVMLDIDLRRGDHHTLAPVRAAWIDHAAKRVVLDARELEQNEDLLPGLPRTGAISDDQVRRFNDDYVRAYGDRGVERDTGWRLRRGDEELRFGVEPRADLQAAPRRDDRPLPPGALAAGAGGALPGPAFEESRRIDAIMEGRPVEGRSVEGRSVEGRPADRDRLDEPRRLMDRDAVPGTVSPAMPPMTERERLEADRLEADRLEADRRLAADRLDVDRRADRVDDASTLHPEGAIDPRELDGRVRIDEGATVDDRTPIGGVRYEGGATPRDYGRPDEVYGPEYGSGRIGFDRVVSRHPLPADEPADPRTTDPSLDPADAARRLDDAGDRTLDRRPDDRHEVRYRRYDDPRTDRR